MANAYVKELMFGSGRIRGSSDSPLEGSRFELPVPRATIMLPFVENSHAKANALISPTLHCSGAINRWLQSPFARTEARFAVARTGQRKDLGPEITGIWRMSVLNFRWPIDLALTVASHGWSSLHRGSGTRRPVSVHDVRVRE
jgi:hypothetical protein